MSTDTLRQDRRSGTVVGVLRLVGAALMVAIAGIHC